jgi:hypothetical protein
VAKFFEDIGVRTTMKQVDTSTWIAMRWGRNPSPMRSLPSGDCARRLARGARHGIVGQTECLRSTPTWGGMLSGEGRRSLETAPYLAIFPGMAISIVVLAFNMFGDAVRDLLEPRLRTR